MTAMIAMKPNERSLLLHKEDVIFLLTSPHVTQSIACKLFLYHETSCTFVKSFCLTLEYPVCHVK